MFRKQLLTVASLALMTTTALAADPQEAVDDVFGWGGFYVGAQVGYGTGDGSHTPVVDGLGFLNAPFGTDIDGILGGVNAGYNVQNGNFVFGLNLEVNASDINGLFSNDPVANNDDGYATDVEWFGAATLRAGYSPSSSPRTQFFLLGGVAVAEIDATNGDLDPIAGGGFAFDCTVSGCASGNETEFGYTVGAGIEHAVDMNGQDWILSLKYNYYDFGDVRVTTVTQPGGAPHSFDVDTSFHTITAGVSVKF